MKSRSKLGLLFILTVGCGAGAAAGTDAPRMGADAGGDSGRKDSGANVTPTDNDAAIDEEDAAATDAGKNDASTTDSATSDATNDSAASDAQSDAAQDAPVDAPKDVANDAPAEAATDAGKVCTIDDGTWVSDLTEYDLVANGKVWYVDADGTLLGSTPLSSISGMANGPCKAQVGTCHLDATTWRSDLGEYHIVSGGKLWKVDLVGNLIGSSDLTSFTGIASGPCNGKTGADCTFEAGAWRSDLGEYHLVADGKIWAIKGSDGSLVGSTTLTSISGVAAGPCAGQAGTCHVDAFTYRPDTSEIHVIAKGNLYVLDTAGSLKSTTSLMSISGMANGPCK